METGNVANHTEVVNMTASSSGPSALKVVTDVVMKTTLVIIMLGTGCAI